MTDDVITIGGLLEVAEQQQAAVAKAVAAADVARHELDTAAQRWDRAGAKIVTACGTAIGEAVTKEVQTLASRIEAPFVVPVQRLERAAASLNQAARTVEWTWLTVAFLLGMLAGIGLLWWGMQPRLNRLLQYASDTYEQTAPKMPAAPANPAPAPKKGGK